MFDGKSGIFSILENGINLKLESAEEEIYYTTKMCEFYNEETEFKAYLTGAHTFELEYDQNTPIMEVLIKNSTLFIIPYIEDIFEAFTEMLNFIAKNHQDIVSELRGEEFSSIQNIKDVEKENKDKTEIQDDEEDSDDFEWI